MSTLDTKFADMPSGVRNRWVAWVQSHDWGRECRYYDGSIYGAENWEADMNAEKPVMRMTELKSFSTPREMRDWAGY